MFSVETTASAVYLFLVLNVNYVARAETWSYYIRELRADRRKKITVHARNSEVRAMVKVEALHSTCN